MGKIKVSVFGTNKRSNTPVGDTAVRWLHFTILVTCYEEILSWDITLLTNISP